MKDGRVYQIDRILNNNVLIVCSPEKEEQILVGRGIGFQAKRGMTIQGDDIRIEKRFALQNGENQSHFQQLFSMVPPEVIGITEEIIVIATATLGIALHEHIHVALADHVGFALTRLQGGLTIENPFLEEIRTLYPEEWQIATQGSRMIEERFHIPIPEAEIGFLTLHIHSATHTRGLSETVRLTDSVNLVIRAIEREMGEPIQRDQLNYARLIIHLRFAIQRMMRNQSIHNPLCEAILEKIPECYRIAQCAAQEITKRLHIPVPIDEVAYLALHIARLMPAAQDTAQID